MVSREELDSINSTHHTPKDPPRQKASSFAGVSLYAPADRALARVEGQTETPNAS